MTRVALARIRLSGKSTYRISADDDIAPLIVETIRAIANTGNVGDGVIAMYDIIQSIRIHSNEKDKGAKTYDRSNRN